MSLVIVPTDSTGAQLYEQQTTLDGATYNLYFNFNQRTQCWYLSIADSSGVDIYNGVKIITGLPLLRKCKDPRRPPGDFLCLSSVPSNPSPPGLQDLYAGSGRCTLYYLTGDWVAQLAGMACTVSGSLVTFTKPQSLTAGAELVFAAEPLAQYTVVQSTNQSLTATINPQFAGVGGATTAQVTIASLFGQAPPANAAVAPLSTYGLQ